MGIIGLTPPGGPELIVILVIVVLLFGAKKLPELGSSVGKSIKNFKKGIGEGAQEGPDVPAKKDELNESLPETGKPR